MRRRLALVAMLRPMQFLARLATVVHVLARSAFRSCCNVAYHALTRTLLALAQGTFNVLHRVGGRWTRPPNIEIALGVEVPFILQEPLCHRKPCWSSRKAWWNHHPNFLREAIHRDRGHCLRTSPRMQFPQKRSRRTEIHRIVCLRVGFYAGVVRRLRSEKDFLSFASPICKELPIACWLLSNKHFDGGCKAVDRWVIRTECSVLGQNDAARCALLT